MAYVEQCALSGQLNSKCLKLYLKERNKYISFHVDSKFRNFNLIDEAVLDDMYGISASLPSIRSNTRPTYLNRI